MRKQPNERTRHLFVAFTCVLILSAVYLGSYLYFRNHHIETWNQDHQAYVIFPQNNRLIYYAFRPLAYIDTKLTGMRFHIGPHQEE